MTRPAGHAPGRIRYFIPWLMPGLTVGGRDRQWWSVALGNQFFHHIEHLLLVSTTTMKVDYALTLQEARS